MSNIYLKVTEKNDVRPVPTLSPMEIKKNEAWARNEKPALR